MTEEQTGLIIVGYIIGFVSAIVLCGIASFLRRNGHVHG